MTIVLGICAITIVALGRLYRPQLRSLYGRFLLWRASVVIVTPTGSDVKTCRSRKTFERILNTADELPRPAQPATRGNKVKASVRRVPKKKGAATVSSSAVNEQIIPSRTEDERSSLLDGDDAAGDAEGDAAAMATALPVADVQGVQGGVPSEAPVQSESLQSECADGGEGVPLRESEVPWDALD